MPPVYFDSSALVKLLVEEDGSTLATTLWQGCAAAFSSRLAYPEVRAALAAAARRGRLRTTALTAAEAVWEDAWASMHLMELTALLSRRAGELAAAEALRGADAVHLATALALSSADPIVAVWDRDLRSAAIRLGVTVVPAP